VHVRIHECIYGKYYTCDYLRVGLCEHTACRPTCMATVGMMKMDGHADKRKEKEQEGRVE